ncbi:FAD-binding protein [Escherichia coli]|nr:FAD-binding protein [Escherichia coli]
MCKTGPEAILELEHMGLPFSRLDDGRIYQRPFGGQSKNFLSTFNCKGLPHKVTTVHVIKRHPPALQGAMYLLNTCLYLL